MLNGARVNQQELTEDDIFAAGRTNFRLFADEPIEYIDGQRSPDRPSSLPADDGRRRSVTAGHGGRA